MDTSQDAGRADDFGDMFHSIVDMKLDAAQDKVAILVADGRHPAAHTCVIKPVGVAVCYAGVMAGGAASEALEAVESVQWLSGGQHVVYTRVGAAGVPTEVWLHHVGDSEAQDRQLYEEVRPPLSAHRPAVVNSCSSGVTVVSAGAL